MNLRIRKQPITQTQKYTQLEQQLKKTDRKRKQINYIQNPHQEVGGIEYVPLRYGSLDLITYQKFRVIREKWEKKSLPEIIDFLRLNNQLQSESLDDKLDRAADAELNGSFDGCPNCNRGKIYYDMSAGLFQCRGFYSANNHFRQCGQIYDTVLRGKCYYTAEDLYPIQQNSDLNLID